jgi:hypothetical protein
MDAESSETPQLEIVLNAGPKSDARELIQLSSYLKDELGRLDEVKEAKLKKLEDVPEGTKPIEIIALGSILVLKEA